MADYNFVKFWAENQLQLAALSFGAGTDTLNCPESLYSDIIMKAFLWTCKKLLTKASAVLMKKSEVSPSLL